MHSGEQNRLLESVPVYPADSQTTIQEADAAKNINKTQQYRNSRFSKVLGVAALSIATTSGMFFYKNRDYLVGERETLAPVAADCDGAPDELLSEKRQSDPSLTQSNVHALSDLEDENKDRRSAATNFNPFARTPEVVQQDHERPHDILLAPWNFRHELDSFTMEKSGINVRVLTSEPADIEVNRRNIETVFNMSMENWHIYSDSSMNDLYYCAYQSVIVNRESAGKTITIVVPPKHNYFIYGLHARGFTAENGLPGVTGANVPGLELWPLHPYVELPHMMFFTGKSTMPWLANQNMTKRLVHEFVAHEVPRLVNAEPLLHPDEVFSKISEDQLMAMYFEGSSMRTIAYPGA